jgi:hypothetical protein
MERRNEEARYAERILSFYAEDAYYGLLAQKHFDQYPIGKTL